MFKRIAYYIVGMVNIQVSNTTHKQLAELVVHYKHNEPDTKVTHDYIIRKLLNKFEGDLK
jgi:hypothetical protein